MVPPVLHPRSQGIFGEARFFIKRFTDNRQWAWPSSEHQLQPLGQGIVSCGKASHTCPVIEMIRAAIDADPKLQVMDCWKSFTIADTIILIEAAMDELKPETDNDYWKNL